MVDASAIGPTQRNTLTPDSGLTLVRPGRALVDGHSSHHVKPFEVYHGRLILYGCGDWLTDYEGIGGHEEYRPELSLIYFPRLDPKTGRLVDLEMRPTRMERMQLHRTDERQAEWLADALTRPDSPSPPTVGPTPEGYLRLA